MNFLISGCGGFIGFHLANYLCKKYVKSKVFGFDNLDNFYSVKLKKKRLNILKENKNFSFSKIDLNDKTKLFKIFKKNKIDIVLHLAAQAGVRDSLKIPKKYFESNFLGYLNLINYSNNFNVKKFIFASSSSVYGDQKKYPLNEKMLISPKNIYSATKMINENIAEDISKNSKMKIIGLRFFTVYGEYGRPDMLIFKYLKSLLCNKKFSLYNRGKNYRDYTHIDDVIKIIDKIIIKKIQAKFDIFNICSKKPIDTFRVVKFISEYLNETTKLDLKKRNEIEVLKTHGNNSKILKFVKYKIKKDIFLELPKIIDWYKKNKIWKF
jgi:UDP-glucuronate 4-epimerase